MPIIKLTAVKNDLVAFRKKTELTHTSPPPHRDPRRSLGCKDLPMAVIFAFQGTPTPEN